MHDLMIAVWGGMTVILASTAIYYAARVKSAESRRDQAENIATEANARSKFYEDEFVKAKDFFEKSMARPIQAVITDEQIDRIAAYVGGKLLPYTSRLGTPQ